MSIRNYNAFLREVKKKHGLTQKQAQATYRRFSKHIGGPAKGVHVARHPRLIAAAAHPRRVADRTRRVEKISKKTSGKRSIDSIAEWRQYHMTRGGDTVRIVSSADYGRKRGRR